MAIQSPISKKALLSTVRMIWKTWDDRTPGNLLQVKRIIGWFEGIKADQISALLVVPTKYIEEICDTLLKGDDIVRSADGGYAIERDLPEELMCLIGMRRVVYGDEISKELSITPEKALELASGLVEAGFLIRTSKGGYLFKNDREIVLMAIKRLKGATPGEVAEELEIPEKYATLLCNILMDDFLVLRAGEDKFVPAKTRITILLQLIKRLGLATPGTVGRKIGITTAYAGLLCNSLAKDGYLQKTTSEAGEVYTLSGAHDDYLLTGSLNG